MAKFSVRKSLTIFVIAIAVAIVGVMSYTKMTPNLLPNMDFPYIMIMTTYPGASPEVVEEEVTKPIEESMATLEHIDSVSSTSSENYSMVTLVFEDDTDLDTAGVDVQQAITQLQGTWDDSVGSPYVLKINPSMIPVSMVAVSMEGKDITELSDFVENEIEPDLEGTTGVARISAMGLVTNEVHVVISQDKIDALNSRMQDAVNGQLDEAQSQLDSARSQLASAQSQLRDAQNQLTTGQTELGQTSDAVGELSSQSVQIIQTEIDLRNQIVELTEQKNELESLLSSLETINSSYTALQTQLSALEAIQAQIDACEDDTEAIEQILSSAGFSSEEELQASIDLVKQSISAIEESLRSQDIEPSELGNTISEIQSGIAQIDDGIAQLNDSIAQLRDGSAQISDAMGTLNSVQMSGILGIAEGYTQIAVNSSTVASGLSELESGQETLDENRESALDAADLSGTLNISMISQILAAQNFSMPAGYVEDDGQRYMVSVGDEYADYDDMRDTLLFNSGIDGIGEIYLTDVADVFVTDNSDETYAKLNGYDGVILSFEKQSNAATAEVCDSLNERLEELEAEYDGLTFVSLMDQGEYIHTIINSILSSLLYGAVFSVIVLLIFLRDPKPTVVTIISIPLSLLFALALMYFSGITLNLISLSGLAVAVGMLVDNAIVVIENIYRLRAKGATAAQAAVAGTKQVAGAVTASTLTTICVFLPIVFAHGYTRQLFTDLALTLGFSLIASLLISLTLVPAMASKLFKGDRFIRKKPEKEHVIYRKYRKIAGWMLDHKKIVFPIALALLILSGLGALARGFSFMPNVDSNQITLTITMPEDCTRDEAVEISDEVLERIAELDDVNNIGAMMGSSMSLGSLSLGSSGNYDITVYVDMEDNVSGAETGDKIIEMCDDIDCTITSDSSSGMSLSALTGSGVEVELYGDDTDALSEAAAQVGAAFNDMDIIESVDNGLKDAEDAIHITVDKDEAMRHNLTVAQVYTAVAGKLSNSATAINIDLENTTADVVVETGSTVTLDDLKTCEIEYTDSSGETQTVRLDQIASFEKTASLTSISRSDQKRMITVTATPVEGENVTLATKECQTVISGLELPEGVSYSFGGENDTIMEAVRQLGMMLALGIVLVYFIMVAQFQSLKSPFIVMFTIPLAFTGGFIALLICGMDVSVIALIGFVMLTGIIVNNGIVLVDYINQLRAGGMERRKAIIQAGVTRMRPIFMTSLTTVLGLVVMALGRDSGTALVQPMAVVCIGGLLYATLMTLLIVPCIYDIMSRKPIKVYTEEELTFDDIIEDEELKDEACEADADDAGRNM